MSIFVYDGTDTRRSQVIQTDKSKDMINAMKRFSPITGSFIPFDGTLGQKATITIPRPYRTDNYVFDSDDYDFEFDIPFGYKLNIKKAEIIIYNVPKQDVNIFTGKSIKVSAGYGNNVNQIFNGIITSVKTKRDDLDRITTIKAATVGIVNDLKIDLNKLNVNLTYTNRVKASYILKDLLKVTRKPIMKFSIARDYTYADDETIDGNLLENIDRLAAICGSIVFYSNGIYVCPYTDFRKQSTAFTANYLNGLLDVNEWSEEERNGTYVDTLSGYDVTMMINPQIHALSVFKVNTAETESLIDYNEKKGIGTKLIALSGSHEYDGEKMITKVRGVV